jgi:hypothetical protein
MLCVVIPYWSAHIVHFVHCYSLLSLCVQPFTGAEFQSEWATLPRDVLAKVLSERYTLCCLARQVCKAWRQHAFANPTAVDVTLASPQELFSLAAWMQHLSPNLAVSEDLEEASLREGSSRDRPPRLLYHCMSDVLVEATASQGQTRAEQGSAQASQTSPSAESPDPSQAPPSKAQQASEVKCSTQQLASLKLSAWAQWKVSIQDGKYIFEQSPQLAEDLWQGLQRAQIHNLTLGEFFSDHFCDRLPCMKASQVFLPDKSSLPGLANLQALTLHLNLFGVQAMFLSSSINGGMHSLHELSQLTSLTLKASEVLPEGGRKKHSVPAEQLLHSLPDSLRTLALHNFRDRWKCFGDLSCRPQLVNLDLTESSCIFPPEAEAWTQLRELHLGDSLVWLMHRQPFQFSALNQLTKLCLVDCFFGVHAPGQHGNTHHYVYQQMQAPTSIVDLDICTKNIKVTGPGI